MIKQISPTNLTHEADKLKDELVQVTLQSLRMNKDYQFNISTEEGIHQAVDYLVDFHLQQKIANGEVQIITLPNTVSERNGVEV